MTTGSDSMRAVTLGMPSYEPDHLGGVEPALMSLARRAVNTAERPREQRRPGRALSARRDRRGLGAAVRGRKRPSRERRR